MFFASRQSLSRWWDTWWFVCSFWRSFPLTWALILLWQNLLAWDASWQIGTKHVGGVAPAKTQKNHDSVSWEATSEKCGRKHIWALTDFSRHGEDSQCPFEMEPPVWCALLKPLRPIGTPFSGLPSPLAYHCLAGLKRRHLRVEMHLTHFCV